MTKVVNVKNWLPLMNRILIRRADPPTETPGGVLLPDARKNSSKRGWVVAVGPGATTTDGKKIPCTLKVGDAVLLPDYGATKIEDENQKEYFLYKETDILAVINE